MTPRTRRRLLTFRREAWPWARDISCALLLIVAGISWWIVGYSAECLLRGCS